MLGVLDRHVGLRTVRVDRATGALYSMGERPIACLIWLTTRMTTPVGCAFAELGLPRVIHTNETYNNPFSQCGHMGLKWLCTRDQCIPTGQHEW